MLASDAMRAVIVLGFVLVRSTDDLWLLYVLGFTQATVGTFFTPARTALVPHVVPGEGLLAANSLSQVTRLITGVVGAGAAGLLATGFGMVWPAFVVDSATFVASFVLVLGCGCQRARWWGASRGPAAASPRCCMNRSRGCASRPGRGCSRARSWARRS